MSTAKLRLRRGLAAALGAIALLAAAGPGGAGATGDGAQTPCASIAAAEPQSGHSRPPAAPVLFAPDFPRLADCEWGYPLGGWGGVRRGAPRRHVPIVFVHGNQADAENWFLVADQLARRYGYTRQEMYAVSYNGLGNAYAGMPTRSAPSPESVAYWKANPAALANGGHGTADDVNVDDVYRFVRTVQSYTGSDRVQLVAHSLGVTIVRRLLVLHPDLRARITAAVMIAGANHGTTVCRGLESLYFGCDEIAPGTAWLARLNAAGETPGPTCWMTVYNGSEGDPFFAGPDEQSPRLEGAVNVQLPGYYHNDLRVDPAAVTEYGVFLLHHQRGGCRPAR